MASEQDDTVFPEEDHDDDDDDDEEEEEEVLSEDDDDDEDDVIPDPGYDDVINSASPSISSPPADAVTVTVALPASSVPNGGTSVTTTTTIVASSSTPSPRRHCADREDKKPQPLDDSRRLFQRLWTDEDEIELLQGFLDYTTSRGSTHHNDTAFFYDQIKSKLQLDFNKNQLVEKLRRLKKKYRNVVGKISAGKDFSFKSPHDKATFEISRKIWSNEDHNTGRFAVEDSVFDDEDPNLKNHNFNFNNNEDFAEKKSNSTPRPRKRPRSQSQSAIQSEEKRTSSPADNKSNINDTSNNSNFGGLIEETVRSCLSPLFKELSSNAMGIGGRGIGLGFGFGGFGMNAMAMNVMPLSFGGGGGEGVLDERWRKQQILELEVYSKRLELVQDQIREALGELRAVRR